MAAAVLEAEPCDRILSYRVRQIGDSRLGLFNLPNGSPTVNRTREICTEDIIEEDLLFLRNMLRQNGDPEPFIKKKQWAA